MPKSEIKKDLRQALRKFFVILIIFLFSNSAFGDIGRFTTFDDREICEKTKGVWREYGTSLADNCEAKLDKFAIGAQVITYACDCGKGKCWDVNKCVVMQDFQKNYDKKQRAEIARLASEKKARRAEYQENQGAIIKAMVGGKAAVQTGSSGANNSSNNVAQFYGKLMPDKGVVVSNTSTSPVINSVNQQTQKVIDQSQDAAKQVQEGPLGKIFTLPPEAKTTTTPDVASVVAPIPALPEAGVVSPTPFFQQQQEKLQRDVDAATKASPLNNSASPNPASTTVIVDAPGLPQIPLPQ
jgi:hypothetical protein